MRAPFVLAPIVRLAAVTAVLAALGAPAVAQAYRMQPGGELPPYARRIDRDHGGDPRLSPRLVPSLESGRAAIMLTGFWPPTNEMIRRFSTDPVQNPEGWIGLDWEHRGFDVYSFFPEFPGGLGRGEGDFEVDYQDTERDFWEIASLIHPIAVITFGRSYPDTSWELEWRQRNLAAGGWAGDYLTPYKPDACPPEEEAPEGAIRYSTLPLDAIVSAVNAAQIGVTAYADDSGNSGGFLCEYIGYHASWLQALRADPSDPHQAFATGHIHVGSQIDLPEAVAATEITLRALIAYLHEPLLPNRADLRQGEPAPLAFRLDAGPARANRSYLLLAGMSGSDPGAPLPGGLATLPLQRDWLFDAILGMLDYPILADFSGVLDAHGRATARLALPPLGARFAGATLSFAFATMSPWDYASNAATVRVVP